MIEALLESVGQRAGPWLDRAAQAANKQKLREQTERAATLGIFGAPTFALGEELFWGNDRLEDAIGACR